MTAPMTYCGERIPDASADRYSIVPASYTVTEHLGVDRIAKSVQGFHINTENNIVCNLIPGRSTNYTTIAALGLAVHMVQSMNAHAAMKAALEALRDRLMARMDPKYATLEEWADTVLTNGGGPMTMADAEAAKALLAALDLANDVPHPAKLEQP